MPAIDLTREPYESAEHIRAERDRLAAEIQG